MRTKNPFIDEMARFATSAAGVAQSMGEEVRTMVRAQAERLIADMDLVRRDEFDALKAVVAAQAAEIDQLKAALSPAAKRAPKAKP